MPKQKTHKGASKRIKVSSTGKLLRQRAFQAHFLGKKSGATKRLFKQDQSLSSADKKTIKKTLGL